jgi:uncharacterized damage-inducible protein DinB
MVAPVADEREALLGYLAQERYVMTVAAYGLTDDQARVKPAASALSVGGLIKHVTAVERYWINLALTRSQPAAADRTEYEDNFAVRWDETLAGLLAEYEAAAHETEASISEIPDLGRAVPVPRDAPWFPADVEAWSVRWVLLHLITETARHAGHADIIRESIDGATAFPLMAAAEGWSVPSIEPWRPADGSEVEASG